MLPDFWLVTHTVGMDFQVFELPVPKLVIGSRYEKMTHCWHMCQPCQWMCQLGGWHSWHIWNIWHILTPLKYGSQGERIPKMCNWCVNFCVSFPLTPGIRVKCVSHVSILCVISKLTQDSKENVSIMCQFLCKLSIDTSFLQWIFWDCQLGQATTSIRG